MNNKTQNEKYVSHSHMRKHLSVNAIYSQTRQNKRAHKKNSVCPKQNEVEIECDIVTIQSVCGGTKRKSNSWLLWISNELRKSWLISGRLNIYNEFISQPLGFYLPFGDVELKEWPVLIWTRIQTVNDEHRTLCKVT